MKEFVMQETEEMTTFGSVWKRYEPVAELVRCKDCIYGKQLFPDYISCEISEENESGCHASHKPDWFCADGVAKDINVLGNEGR